MIDVKKFENVFGIKKLEIDKPLGKLNIIYAPNGTIKTSFCDGLVAIEKGQPCGDVLDETAPNPSYEIKVDLHTYDETFSNIPLNTICYSGTKDYYLEKDEALNTLAISDEIKKEIASIRKVYDHLMDKIESIFQTSFHSKYMKPQFIKAFQTFCGSNKDNRELLYDVIFSFDLANVTPLKATLKENDFYNSSNLEVKKKVDNEDVSNNASIFDSLVKAKMDDDVLDGTFTFQKLKDTFDKAVENSYFDNEKKRQFYINNKPYDKEAMKNLIDEKEEKIYGSEEVRKQYEKVTKSLGLNDSVRKFRDNVLNKNMELCGELKDYQIMLQTIFVTIIGKKNVELIEKTKNKLEDKKKRIEAALNKTPTDLKIGKIWKRYEHLFHNKKFDLHIENKNEVYLGLSAPSFVKCYPGTKTEITDVIESRFCTGEIRLYNFINFLIDVESKVNDGKNHTILLDDPVESFDYKNKYGIVNYIEQIAHYDNMQLIILTHNFDFYRSMSISLGKITTNSFNKYFAYRYKDNEVKIYNIKNKYYFHITDFNKWKNAPNNCKFFAMIPFMRNVIQLSRNRFSVIKLNDYFHYYNGTEQLTIDYVWNLLEKKMKVAINNANLSFGKSDYYLLELSNTAIPLVGTSPINEIDLEYKILKGMYCRVFLERYLFKKYVQKTGSKPRLKKGNNALQNTNLLFEKCAKRNVLTENELNKCLEINIICPAYVHVNSFMYEPLVDVGSEALDDAVSWLNNSNSPWPL